MKNRVNKKGLQRVVLILTGLLFISIFLAGCGGKELSPSLSEATVPVAQPANPADALPVATSELSGTITQSGSTSVQPLAEKLAEGFMAKNPGVKVIIQGGGSSVGIKAAVDGLVDIGASSRELTAAEKPKVTVHLLCKDGIAIIVHPSNNISNLTKEQIRDIFSGKITNWKEVNGSDRAIHVSAREAGSGTRGAFEEIVMGEDRITGRAILQNSTGALMQVVKGDPDSIGFVSFGYLDDSVKALSVEGVAPTMENAIEGIYPIVRPFLFITGDQPAGPVKAFIDYCTGSEAQQTVLDEGYVPVAKP